MKNKIYYVKAVYGKKEINAVTNVLKNNSLSLMDGKNVKNFEKIVSKMGIKSGRGVKLFPLEGLVNKFEYFFGEDQGRYIIEIKPENLENVENMLKKDSIHFDKLGLVEGDKIILENDIKLSIDDIKEGYKKWLNEYMVN